MIKTHNQTYFSSSVSYETDMALNILLILCLSKLRFFKKTFFEGVLKLKYCSEYTSEWDYSCSTYAKYLEKLIFLAP